MHGRSTPPARGAAVGTRPAARAALGTGTALAALLLAGLLGGCGVTDIPSAPKTVTVLVDPPSASASAPATETPVPTETAPSSTAVPTALAAGAQRGAPHSFAEAAARVAGAKPAGGVTSAFVSPSGNLRCIVTGGAPAPACEVVEGRVTPPQPGLCAPGGASDIGRIELRAGGAVPVCNGDTVTHADAPKLEYGSRTTAAGPVQCVSEETGVTCVDQAHQHGFFLARRTFVTF
ncbi:hypothetical protein [Intrasporangium flavum]|uniref:hypothetical protein n=1 Tax=Intrasporangium flavum TaxID=1428657 RepID=UPI00096F7E03|nr:hypothetical protein [Intrasporangium flavum]